MMQLATCTDRKAFNNALAKIEQTLTIRKSIETAPLIGQQGEKKEIIKEIIRVVEFFLTVTGKELEHFQIIILAGDLYEKFRTDTLEDVIMMFKMARQGEFGKVYKFDTFTVMDWANAYLDRKSEEREKIAKGRKQEAEGEKPQSGKYFHELPQEMQDKFNEKFSGMLERWKEAGAENDFLPPKATESLTAEKHRREIQRLIDNEKAEGFS